MSLVSVTHINPGAVQRRIVRFSQIQKGNEAQEHVAQMMDEIYDKVFAASPVKTGYMRSTIGRRSGQGFEELHVTAYYARFVDKGTSRNRKQPFFSDNVVGASMDMIIVLRALYGTI